jgi:hypothetical protein
MTGVKTAVEMRQRIAAKFGKTSEVTSFPEHVVLFEVPIDGRPQPGFEFEFEFLERASRQRIDAVALGIWRRTEGLIHGFEIKVSRSDLLHELRDLSKSEAAVRSVDRWWLALGDKALLHDDDPVPESWGVLYASGRGLRVLREPSPQAGELDRSLITGLVTRALIAPRYIGQIRYRDGQIATQTFYKRQLDAVRKAGLDRYQEGVRHGIAQGRLEARQGGAA